MELGLLRN